MDPSFTRGFRVDFRPQSQPVVFGLRLKPLTLGHLFLVESLRGEDGDAVTNLALQVFVCSHEHDKAIRALNAWWLPLFLRFWGWFAKPHWIEKDIDVFRKYMAEGLAGPYIRPTSEKGGTCNSPNHWIRYEFALETLGLSRQEAMACSIAELNALYATWAERSGAGTLGNYDAIQGLWDHVRQKNMEAG